MAGDKLSVYRQKRDFNRTPEPKGVVAAKAGYRYLIQKHAASRLHYDFRLELDGVLKSWAVTRGPSLDPSDKRLAVEVEDHPLAYGNFEGIIPKGQYGGGTVMLWDEGTWEPLGDPHQGLKKGKLEFILHGKRLHGEWTLVRMHTKDEKRNNWLLIKHRDDEAKPGDDGAFLTANATSVTSGRSMENIASDSDWVWQSKGQPERSETQPKDLKKKTKDPSTRLLAQDMPAFIAPQLATLSDALPQGKNWLHEIKFDGYRALAYINQGQARLLTRTGQDWTEKFRSIADRLASVDAQTAILDGEIVALNAEGASSFKALQQALSEGNGGALQYYVFDLLYLNGKDLRAQPLLERKKQLQKLIGEGIGGRIFYSEHFTADANFMKRICALHLEGIVSKRADSAYSSGRGRAWLKTKCHHMQEFVIGGFTPPTHKERGIGALLLGYYEEEQLVYAGKVGTGFDQDSSRQIRRKLDRLTQKTMPFASVPADGRRDACWVRPELSCEVEFTEWTADGRLRHPSFQGLREDKPAKEIQRENPDPPSETKKRKGEVVIGGIRISHPDRVIFPQDGITKQQLAEYYLAVAEAMLPYVARRPLSMIRCPEGLKEECFFQRHLGRAQSPYLHEVDVAIKNRHEDYLMIENAAGLLTLVQWGVIELHPWGCRADKPQLPDQIIFDLDPDPALPWKEVIAGVREVRKRMEEFGLQSFVKSTGGKGLHVVIPLARRYGWPTVKAFARAIAQSMEHDDPKRYIATASKAARTGKIFVDYLRNDLTSTAVAPFSARARPGAPVAVPLAWEELRPSLKSADFTIHTVPQRLRRLIADPWADFLRLKQTLSGRHLRALHIEPE